MKTKTILIVLIAMLAVTALVFQSCKKDDPKEDNIPPIYTNGQGEIGEIGGTVKIDDSSSPINGASVVIPEGALQSNVDIKIVAAPSGIFVEGDTEVVLVGFEPEGLTFEKPVEITLPYSNGSSDNQRAFYYNYEEKEISQIPVISSSNGTVKATTNHFSYYFATDGNFGLSIEMLNIDGKVGARLKYMSFNGNEGLNNIPAVSFENAHEALINSEDAVYSHFQLSLYEDDFWSNNWKASVGIRLENVVYYGLMKADITLNGVGNAYETQPLDKEPGGSADMWFQGTPLIFYFDDFTPTTNDFYFVKAKWRLTRHATNIHNYFNRYTELYEVNNEDNDKKLAQMQPFSINDLYKGCIDENYIGGSGAKPSVTTNDASMVDCSSARLHGEIDDLGNTNITQHGFCISENPEPTIDDPNFVNLGETNDLGSFHFDYSFVPPSLKPGTKYYYRTYAKNSSGIGYGNNISFWTSDDTDAPLFTGSEPGSGETVAGNVNIIISVLEGCGMDKVEFYIKPDGGNYTPIGEDLEPSYISDDVYYANISWNTNNIDNGLYSIKAHAYDNAGNYVSKEWEYIVNNSGTNTPPTALFTVSPSSGTTSTNFAFDASGSTDNEDPTSNLQVRWDFDGNGSWDTGWDYNKTQNHQYSSENTYTTKLEVKDTEGLVDEKADNIEVVSEGTPPTGYFTDSRDGQEYAYIEIGVQTWMAENLNYISANSWTYDNDPTNGDIYGRLYTWETAKIVCPNGWHLPSDNEWKILEMALGMSQSEADDQHWRGTDEGGKMKETGTSHWSSPNTGASNSSGFNALPGGKISRGDDDFFHIGVRGYWWTRNGIHTSYVLSRSLDSQRSQVYRGDMEYNKYSVRCLKD